ncbi:hypothetical protein Ancab_010347 [Ancistrocladus abbreviatus]
MTSHLSFSPTTINDNVKNATEISTQANCMSLFKIAIIFFFASLSIATTTREMKGATESKTKNIINACSRDIFASPRESRRGMQSMSSIYWPGMLKMVAKATKQ